MLYMMYLLPMHTTLWKGLHLNEIETSLLGALLVDPKPKTFQFVQERMPSPGGRRTPGRSWRSHAQSGWGCVRRLVAATAARRRPANGWRGGTGRMCLSACVVWDFDHHLLPNATDRLNCWYQSVGGWETAKEKKENCNAPGWTAPQNDKK